jgi:hypothetical protein
MADDVIQVLDNAGNVKQIRAFSNAVGLNTVVNEAATIVDLSGNPVAADPTFDALRITPRPMEVLGVYSIGETTGGYSGLAAGSELFQFRWTDASKLALILRVSVSVVITTAASAAGVVDRQLIIARTWNVSGSGGTSLFPSFTNQLKRRTSLASSVAGDIRIASNAALGAGTKTLDNTGVGIAGTALGSAALTAYQGNQILPLTDLYNVSAGGVVEYPIVLAQNEGCVVRMVSAEPSSAVLRTLVNFIWAEVAAY